MSLDGGHIALRGFRFQFDKTILAVLSQPADVGIEQLQDLGYDDYLVQVKYHGAIYDAGQRKARKKSPILQLIKEYQSNRNKKFVLFIYLKGIAAAKEKLDIAGLDDILGSDASKIDRKDREGFCQQFELVYAVDFQQQYQEVIDTIMGHHNVRKEIAEIYYMMISSHLLQLVVDHPSPNTHKRVINQAQVDDLIRRNQRVIFRSQYALELGRARYCQYIKKTYFKSVMNRDAYERLFIIEANNATTVQEMKDALLHIKTRWSHNSKPTIPDRERFVPYIFFHSVAAGALVELKKQLADEGFKIRDGHDYKGADFSVQSIMEMPTYQNRVLFKMINDESALNGIIGTKSRTKELYQFYMTNPISLGQLPHKHIQIEVENVNEIINIA